MVTVLFPNTFQSLAKAKFPEKLFLFKLSDMRSILNLAFTSLWLHSLNLRPEDRHQCCRSAWVEDGGWWFHRAAVGVGRFVMSKSKAIPACYAEHVLFCSAVTKHRSVTKAKPTGKPNTTGHALLQKDHLISGETSSKSNWELEQEHTTVHVPLEA